MTKKGRNIIIFLIITIIITFTIMIKTVLSIKNNVENKVARLETTVDLDSDIFYLTDENYPDNPYDVASLYLEGYALIYGSFMDNEEVISIIIEQQRKLLAESILKRNTLSNQIKSVLISLEYLKLNSFEIKEINIDQPYPATEEGDEVVVKAIKIGTDGETYTFKYYLKQDDEGKWKITSWENENDKFNFQIKN